jgi:hypothetical protein
MGFSSVNDLMTELDNSKTVTSYWTKTVAIASAATSGLWYDQSRSSGTPFENTFPGTALAWRSCNESTGNGTNIIGIPHGGNTSPDTKHILNVSVSTSNNTTKSTFMLVDLQGYWPGISTASGTAQTLTGTPGSNLRYANGAGCKLYMVTTVAQGATAFSLTSVSYTNQAGTTGRNIPRNVNITNSGGITTIPNSGVTGTSALPHPFLPLQGGDTGVANVASVQFSGTSGAGTVALCLARPLLTIGNNGNNYAIERNGLFDYPSLPRVRDDACLVWLTYAGAAIPTNSGYNGSIQFVWG